MPQRHAAPRTADDIIGELDSLETGGAITPSLWACEQCNVPTVLTVFGATGDLMARKIVPSLFHLWSKTLLPEQFAVVGFSRRDWDDTAFRAHVSAILSDSDADAAPGEVDRFCELFRYCRGQFDTAEGYERLRALFAEYEATWDSCPNRLLYLAVPPEQFTPIFEQLGATGLSAGCGGAGGWTRVMIEKPFGRDAASSAELDALLGSVFAEEQVYRIDHYLAKEMLQGVMNFRFTNNLFETEWGRDAIERIDVTLLEEIGAEKRGAFYDAVGAFRDVGQNHLLQMLALVTMDQPASSSADDIREARAAAIEALPQLTPGEVAENTFRAQHAGYRDIDGVAGDSTTETYFRVATSLRGRRWAGVPVTLESGKRTGEPLKRIVVTFRHPHPCLCSPGHHHTNRIEFALAPDDSIRIVFWTKRPGFSSDVEERTFDFFLYERQAKAQYVEEYARLLYDAVRGDQTLFPSAREVAAMWRFTDPIVEGWANDLVPLEAYEPDAHAVRALAGESLAERRRHRQAGVVGLGKMGAGLALNLIDHGWDVVGWNRTTEVTRRMAEEDALTPAETLAELVAELAPPRVVWVMVPAGAPVDDVLFREHGLAHLLEPGDTVIDGGNSLYADAAPRAERLDARGIRYLDCGTSGGPTGARTGACLMIGGVEEDFDRWEHLFADVSVPGGYRFFPGHGAGHFVKMVHNGIEYGMMQSVAEGFHVLHDAPYDLDLSAVADIYQHGSVIESRLVGWLGDAYADLSDDLESASPVVGHTGEGAWTIVAAREMGVATPVIEASLRFREESSGAPSYAGRVLTALRNAFGGHGLGPGRGPRT